MPGGVLSCAIIGVSCLNNYILHVHILQSSGTVCASGGDADIPDGTTCFQLSRHFYEFFQRTRLDLGRVLHFKIMLTLNSSFFKVIQYGIEECGVANSPTYINVNQKGNIKRVLVYILK